MAYIPSETERHAFLWLQGRMVELLLRHDAPRWYQTFEERTATLGQDVPADLRELAVLFYLKRELFESILPRIKRRLSFVAPRELTQEIPPVHGRIDWPRTASATWDSRPGEPPLEFYTRQRHRHFANPENLLTVVTILDCQARAERLLERETAVSAVQAMRHPLIELGADCARELVFPQFAGLLADARAICAGYALAAYKARYAFESIGALEERVAANLLPGRNSAYDDLLAWRQRFATLTLLDRTNAPVTAMLGADPARDNYLYQLWLFYEFIDLLTRTERLIARAETCVTFRWGNDTDACEYHLQHDRGVPAPLKLWEYSNALPAPGVRPDFYIWRADDVTHPDATVHAADGSLLWRTTGAVLDAKFYRPRGTLRAPASPVKRMLADLQLLGETHGELLFAFQQALPNISIEPDNEAEEVLPPDPRADAGGPLSALAPASEFVQAYALNTHIGIWRIAPLASEQSAQQLVAVLDRVHARLTVRPPLACHAIFLDSLSATAHGQLTQSTGLTTRTGASFSTDLDTLVLCPKPHIAPGRVDLVSLAHDCCANPHVCHVFGRAGISKPHRLTALDAITTAIKATSQVASTDDAIQLAEKQVLTITKRYAELLEPDLTHYARWVKTRMDIGDSYELTPLLKVDQRDTLALAHFLAEQTARIGTQNYAGPALLFTGVLEFALQGSFFKKLPTLYTTQLPRVRLQASLGALSNCKEFGGGNWVIIHDTIMEQNLWQAELAPGHTYTLSAWIDTLKEIQPIRNRAAHHAHTTAAEFETLLRALFGSVRTGMGALNGLLLAWHTA